MDPNEIQKLLKLKGGQDQGGVPFEDMKAKINRLAQLHYPNTISILAGGSYINGKMKQHSDIDIIFLQEKTRNYHRRCLVFENTGSLW